MNFITIDQSKAKKMQKGAKNVSSRFNKHVNKMYQTIGKIIFVVIGSALAIACLIIGMAKSSECPIQPKIPWWLIVFGGTAVCMNALNIFGVRLSICFIENTVNNCIITLRISYNFSAVPKMKMIRRVAVVCR